MEYNDNMNIANRPKLESISEVDVFKLMSADSDANGTNRKRITSSSFHLRTTSHSFEDISELDCMMMMAEPSVSSSEQNSNNSNRNSAVRRTSSSFHSNYNLSSSRNRISSSFDDHWNYNYSSSSRNRVSSSFDDHIHMNNNNNNNNNNRNRISTCSFDSCCNYAVGRCRDNSSSFSTYHNINRRRNGMTSTMLSSRELEDIKNLVEVSPLYDFMMNNNISNNSNNLIDYDRQRRSAVSYNNFSSMAQNIKNLVADLPEITDDDDNDSNKENIEIEMFVLPRARNRSRSRSQSQSQSQANRSRRSSSSFSNYNNHNNNNRRCSCHSRSGSLNILPLSAIGGSVLNSNSSMITSGCAVGASLSSLMSPENEEIQSRSRISSLNNEYKSSRTRSSSFNEIKSRSSSFSSVSFNNDVSVMKSRSSSYNDVSNCLKEIEIEIENTNNFGDMSRNSHNSSTRSSLNNSSIMVYC